MHRATPDCPDDEERIAHDIHDIEVIRVIAEAGDPLVEPSPDHMAHVRALLLEKLHPARPLWRHRVELLVGSGVAAALFVAIVLLIPGRPAIAWDELAKALQERPWIHCTAAGPDGTPAGEQWFSSNREIVAQQSGDEKWFYDLRQKIFLKYVLKENAIYRFSEPPELEAAQIPFLREVLQQLLDPKLSNQFPFPGSELIAQARRTVEAEGKKWLDIELKVCIAGGSRGGPLSIRLRVDPVTNLPHTFVCEGEDGKFETTSFDYPESGPEDIYALGVPRDATVIDRFLTTGISDVLAAQKAGRRRFDDYSAFVLEQRLRPTHYRPMTHVYRVWRKGSKWRIDELRRADLEWAPPVDADLAWWQEHHEEFAFVPRTICTGKLYWDYYLENHWKPGMPLARPGQKNDSGQVIGPNDFLGPDDDPVLPFWIQDLLLEYAGHPTTGYLPDHNFEFLVESQPSGGPPGTILLRGRDTHPRNRGLHDHFRLWIDPAAGSLCMKAEARVEAAPPPRPGDPPEGQWMDIHILEAVAKSPQGHWHPTKIRHIHHFATHELVTKFFVDFEADLPDELFEPLK